MKYILLLLFFFTGVLFSSTLNIKNKDNYQLIAYYEYSESNIEGNNPLEINPFSWVKEKEELSSASYQPYWVHFTLNNQTEKERRFFLTSSRSYIFSFEYFLVKNGEVSFYDKDDLFYRTSKGEFKTSYRTFPLVLEAHKKVDVFFKISNANRIAIPSQLVTEKYLLKESMLHYFLEGLFFATIMIMALYNLNLYFITKYKPHLYYLCYSFFLILYQSSAVGILHFLTDFSPFIIYLVHSIGTVGFIVAIIFFIYELFDVKKKLVNLNIIFYSIILMFFLWEIGVIISYQLNSYQYIEFFYNLINITIPIYIIFVLFILYYLFYKLKNRIAFIYAVGWSFVALSGMFIVLSNMGFIEKNFSIDYFFQIVMMVETLLLSILLAYQIKELKEKQQKQEILLLRQNRLASMGEMINIIAHQWRQPLAGINGVVLQFDVELRKAGQLNNLYEKYLDDIENLTKHLSKTISDFMNFFKRDKVIETFYTREVFDELQSIILKRLESKIVLKYTETKEIKLKSYRSELLQVLLIIVNNAIDACLLSKNNISTIIIAVSEEKDAVLIAIENDGEKIQEEIVDKIFDPYFTTKHQSKGTGMGLYIVKMIIEKSMLGEVHIYNKNDGVVVELKIKK